MYVYIMYINLHTYKYIHFNGRPGKLKGACY